MDYFTLQTFFISLIALYFISYVRKWLASSRSPPSLPIIGHLHLLTDMPHHTFTKLAEKLGPIIYLRLGQVPTIVVSSPELARLVLKTHDQVFSNRPRLVSSQYLSFNCSDVTFSPYGPSGSEVNVSELFFSLANDILCRVAFGRRFTGGVAAASDEGEKRHLAAVLTETQELFAGMSVGDFFPEWEWVQSVSGYRRRLKKNLEELRRVCDEIIEEHLNSGGNKEDLVDVLLKVQKHPDNLKALLLDMFVAGTDTTAATLECTMTELAKHPELMKIPAKTRVLINTYAIGRDPPSWDHPLQYNPKRFDDPDVGAKDQDFRFLPFGGGRRGCPGYTFGLATEIALGQLLFHFDWELPRGFSTDDGNVNEIFGLATRKRTPLILVPTVKEEL
ncbi:wound-induced protein 1-like [Hibiscus syriacus]|uniref:Wound-induced protein 1-like n=1 Tax=Hibiscus syriacus TaxID=106335 RepID=A0A6A2Z955_HIBSY|nr:wound-induced protein 1-like [Hibiscus syriacus]